MDNQRFIRALRKQPVDMTPVWIMRQAGRYLPEYRALRSQFSDFTGLMKNPELACEATLQPLARFDLDAAIVFSDILTIPDGLGLGLYFAQGEGPQFKQPVRDTRQIFALPTIDIVETCHYVFETIRLIKQAMSSRPLIGFAGSPWTVATYMVEGGASKQFARIKRLMRQEPEAFQHLMDLMTKLTSDYLIAQINAGADVVMVFDTWGGQLTTADYQQYCLNPLREIVDAIRRHESTHVPIISFTKQGNHWLDLQAATGVDALGLDWTIDISEARNKVGDRVALQGNLDPTILHAKPQEIEAAVAELLAAYGPGCGHVFNLGHGIHPDAPPEHVQCLVDAVHRLSRQYHSA